MAWHWCLDLRIDSRSRNSTEKMPCTKVCFLLRVIGPFGASPLFMIAGDRQHGQCSNDMLLAMLPPEFRRDFFLAHMDRTITNMNARPQPVEQLVQ